VTIPFKIFHGEDEGSADVVKVCGGGLVLLPEHGGALLAEQHVVCAAMYSMAW